MIIVGSRALQYYNPGVKVRDLDIIASYDEAVAYSKKIKARSFYPINGGASIFMKGADGGIVEAELTWTGSRAKKFEDFILGSPRAVFGHCSENGWLVPSLDVLYMLKMSHRYLKDSPHFLKTMQDIHMLRGVGCSIQLWMQEFYEQRMKDTYTYNLPKLNVSKESFFDSYATGVEQKYDHDSIHEAVAIADVPAYTRFVDGPVMCSKEKFFACTRDVRLNAVLEESYVLALERSLVPFSGGKTPEEAFKMALMKVCTSITSGWFREFAWEHYDLVVALAEALGYNSYVEAFERGVQSGIVKLKG